MGCLQLSWGFATIWGGCSLQPFRALAALQGGLQPCRGVASILGALRASSGACSFLWGLQPPRAPQSHITPAVTGSWPCLVPVPVPIPGSTARGPWPTPAPPGGCIWVCVPPLRGPFIDPGLDPRVLKPSAGRLIVCSHFLWFCSGDGGRGCSLGTHGGRGARVGAGGTP